MSTHATDQNKTKKMFGLIGYPLQHSLSPFLHEYLLHENNQNGCYHAFEIEKEKLDDAVLGLKSLGFIGFNVTIPFKQLIMSHLDKISEEAQLIGAVNTVLIKNSSLHGFNTDGKGFNLALQKSKVVVKNKTAVILGAGGACRAILVSLILGGIDKMYLFNRTLSRAEQLVEEVVKATGFSNFHTGELQELQLSQSLESSQLIINTTPLGMWPKIEVMPYNFNFDAKNITAIDLIYNPLETRFLKSAQKAGAKTVDGLDMFIYQGVESLKIWTEGKVDINFNFKKLRTFLNEKMQTHE